MAESLENSNLTEQTADTGSGNLNEQAEDIIFERAITLSTDPVLQLYPLLRKHFHHRQFDQAVKDLEQLELAKYFPDKVPGRATIIERFRTFLLGLPETAEEAKKEKEGALENLEKIVKKIAQRIKK